MWECSKRGNCDDGFGSSSDSLIGAIGSFTGGSVSNPGDSPEDPNGDAKEQLHSGSNSSDSDSGESDPDPDDFATYKDDSALRDQQSTGRKRAAKLFPLDAGKPCDWKRKKNCGGGKFPIVGCADGSQQARHHGPDKNTLNNEKGNVHRICHSCHNRWHTLNDPDYVWGDLYALHSPVEATDVELQMNEVFWNGRKVNKPEH